jgi:hypothetical protein
MSHNSLTKQWLLQKLDQQTWLCHIRLHVTREQESIIILNCAVLRPLHCTETFTPCIFIPILGTCFFAFQLYLGAFCLQFVDVSLNFDTLKLYWVSKIGIFRISGINLSHLGADLSILGAKKRFRAVKYP